MTVLVVGGAASGKSEYAERLLCRMSGAAPRIYLATMQPFGSEAAARIERHRAQRAGRGFAAVERYTGLAGLDLPRGCAVLLEDVGNLCANELFDPAGSGDGAADAVVRGVARLRELCDTLVIVTNECGAGGASYAGDTLRYLRVLGEVNQRLAAVSDAVCEVACGIAAYCKGEEPDVGV
jgi:adenosylcobinamide kinase/adenosylcobinamide-phosphate guanylyltransferase